MPKNANVAIITRLEDLITLSKEVDSVEVEVDLKKQVITQKAEEDADTRMATEMYLLMACYSQPGAKTEAERISRVYAHGWADDDRLECLIKRELANSRLKMDYERLMEAGVIFDEKYF